MQFLVVQGYFRHDQRKWQKGVLPQSLFCVMGKIGSAKQTFFKFRAVAALFRVRTKEQGVVHLALVRIHLSNPCFKCKSLCSVISLKVYNQSTLYYTFNVDCLMEFSLAYFSAHSGPPLAKESDFVYIAQYPNLIKLVKYAIILS